MKKVVREESVYEPLETIQNLEAIAQRIDDNIIQIELTASYFAEGNPEIALSMTSQHKK